MNDYGELEWSLIEGEMNVRSLDHACLFITPK